jgi:chemotaxis signal transduction protein
MLPRTSRRPPPAPRADFVVFTAAGGRFALPTRAVVAVAEVPPRSALPHPGRPEVLGLVAHRGRAVALIDLGACLDRPPGDAASARYCVVVADGERQAAIPVDAIEGLARVPADQGLPPECETFDPARTIFAEPSGGAR